MNPQIILNAAADPTGTYVLAQKALMKRTFTWVALGTHGSTDTNLERLLTGDIYEVLMWPRWLSDSEITAVTTYLYGKWGIST